MTKSANRPTKDLGPVSGESPGPIRTMRASICFRRPAYCRVLRSRPQSPGLICRPRLRDPFPKSRKQNAGSGVPIPSSGLHGVLASPGNGRGAARQSPGMTSGPVAPWIAPKKAIGRRSGTTIGGGSRKGNEYAADQSISSSWSEAPGTARKAIPGGGKGEAMGKQQMASRKEKARRRKQRGKRQKAGVTVYALYGPDRVPMYVGQTRLPLPTRLMWHRRKARSGDRSPVAIWIERTERTRGAVVIKALVWPAVWDTDEIIWIERMRNAGHTLLNCTRGGTNAPIELDGRAAL